MPTHTCFPIDLRAAVADAQLATTASATRHRIRIMTASLARDGDVIEPLGMDIANYMDNPIVLWAHDAAGRTPSAGLPIGRTLSLDRHADGIDATFEFLPDDPFAQRVQNAWQRGFLRTASIGWESKRSLPLPNGRGLRHTQTELLEWSLVPLPADPGASRELWLAGLRSLGFSDLLGEAHPTSPSNGESWGEGTPQHRDTVILSAAKNLLPLPPSAGEGWDGGETQPSAIHHPSLGALVAELADACDYLHTRLGGRPLRSPDLRRDLTRISDQLAHALRNHALRDHPVSTSSAPRWRPTGNDTAVPIDHASLVTAAAELRSLARHLQT